MRKVKRIRLSKSTKAKFASVTLVGQVTHLSNRELFFSIKPSRHARKMALHLIKKQAKAIQRMFAAGKQVTLNVQYDDMCTFDQVTCIATPPQEMRNPGIIDGQSRGIEPWPMRTPSFVIPAGSPVSVNGQVIGHTR